MNALDPGEQIDAAAEARLTDGGLAAVSLESLKEQSAQAVQDELNNGLLDNAKATLAGVEGIAGIGPLAQEASNATAILRQFVMKAETFLASRTRAQQSPESDPPTYE